MGSESERPIEIDGHPIEYADREGNRLHLVACPICYTFTYADEDQMAGLIPVRCEKCAKISWVRDYP